MLCTMLKVILTFKSVDETLECNHSNESYEQHFHVVLFTMLFKVILTFTSLDKTLACNHSSNESY